MEDEAHGDDLGAHLHSEDAHEDRLELLQLQGQDGLVIARYPGVHGHDHAVAHDGDDDQPLEGRPCHEPYKQPPETEQHLGSLRQCYKSGAQHNFKLCNSSQGQCLLLLK